MLVATHQNNVNDHNELDTPVVITRCSESAILNLVVEARYSKYAVIFAMYILIRPTVFTLGWKIHHVT